MKKILNEWKKFVSEAEQAPELKYGNEGFEKRFIDSFSRSTQDRAFLKKIAEEDRFNMTGMTDKITKNEKTRSETQETSSIFRTTSIDGLVDRR